MPVEPTSHHDLKDKPSAFHAAEAREQFAREYMVAVETMNLVREQLNDCALREGVNSYVNCRELRLRYFELCKDRFHGMPAPPGIGEPAVRGLPGVVQKPRATKLP